MEFESFVSVVVCRKETSVRKSVCWHLDINFSMQFFSFPKKSRQQSRFSTSNLTNHCYKGTAGNVNVDAVRKTRKY